MANALSVLAPKILAQGLLALRGSVLMPSLVNRDYTSDAAKRGTVVTIPIPSAVATRTVAPGATPVAAPDIGPTQALVPLDQWKEAPFNLTDKEMLEVAENSVFPMQASEAVKSLADTVNAFIFSKYKGVYGYAGTAGTTPFATTTVAGTDARKVLNNQLAPLNPRALVLNPDAEANALNLQAFQNYSWSNSADAIREGKIDRRLGFMFGMDQQVPSHTAGSLTGVVDTSGAGNTAGVSSVLLATGAGEAIALLEGDIITFANHSQTYVVTADMALGASLTGSVSIAPVLQVTVPTATVVTVKTSHVVNLGFHRDAFAFASRPLLDSGQGLGNIITSMTDPLTGLSLRLEISRQHKQTNWSFDILYGAALVRRELATRLAG